MGARPILNGQESFLAPLLASAHVQTGGTYELTWSTIDGGSATFSTGDVYELGGTIGQPDAGTMSGETYSLGGGFWGFATNVVNSVQKLFLPMILKSPSRGVRAMSKQASRKRLARRQREILQYAMAGRSNKEIARFMQIKEKTGSTDFDVERLFDPLDLAKIGTESLIQHQSRKTQKTVRNQMTTILRKTDAFNRTQAVVLALQRGWIRWESA